MGGAAAPVTSAVIDNFTVRGYILGSPFLRRDGWSLLLSEFRKHATLLVPNSETQNKKNALLLCARGIFCDNLEESTVIRLRDEPKRLTR